LNYGPEVFALGLNVPTADRNAFSVPFLSVSPCRPVSGS